MKLRLFVVTCLVATALACGGPGVPPPGADDAIPLDGTHVKLDAVDSHKYLHYAVGTHIDAPPDVVWGILTDAPGFPSWNSTVNRIDGAIAAGEKIGVNVKVAPDQVFELTVSTFEPDAKMVWEDGNAIFKGVRTFTLEAKDGGTDWTMKEVFTGAALGFIASQLPDFGPDFETWADDLEREAEKRAPPPAPAPAVEPTTP